MNHNKRLKAMLLMSLLPFAVMVLSFELLPALMMIVDSFRADGGSHLTLRQYFTALSNPYYLKAIWNSMVISLYSTVAGIAVALLMAYSVTRLSERVRDGIILFSNMTSNFAGVPLAFAYIILLGNNGIITILLNKWGWDVFSGFNLYSWSGLALVYVYFQIPLAILLLYPTYYGIKEQWIEASALLGASRMQFWRHIGLPILLPGVTGTASILFANSMGAYATAYALVGGNYNLLAIRIGSLIAGDVITRPQLGSALAVLLGLLMLGSMWLNERMMRRIRRDLT
ncbi:ABC transporter permease [Ferviditalea candida]|uniref:ABC transporter permease subunit n=1 Tax=Ferviditalea candida TaxID=3108399 RepID=A0ABU5ZI48_9BACL|nr:ABC transporter permease subunit [Paenibacillaceae bacterium T2]